QDALPREAQPQRDVERHEDHVRAREAVERRGSAPYDARAACRAEENEPPEKGIAVPEPEQRWEIEKAPQSREIAPDRRELQADGRAALLADEGRDLSEERAVRDEPDDSDEPRKYAPDELGRHGAQHDFRLILREIPSAAEGCRGTRERPRAVTTRAPAQL